MSVVSSGRLTKRETETDKDGTAKEVPDFKGVIQDMRLNGKLVTFFGDATTTNELQGLPTAFGNVTISNVLKGVVSDDSCVIKPCHNGGTCLVTWNDYRYDLQLKIEQKLRSNGSCRVPFEQQFTILYNTENSAN